MAAKKNGAEETTQRRGRIEGTITERLDHGPPALVEVPAVDSPR